MNRRGARVLGAFINAVDWPAALECISNWAAQRQSRYVCICNVHSVVMTSRDAEFGWVVNDADMATPDGAPVAWMLRRLGFVGQQRINGPDLMWKYCEQAAAQGEAVFFYGSAQATLDALRVRLMQVFPELMVAGMVSPPFRPLSAEEDTAMVERINGSGAGVMFVSLGCPRQEMWMAAHRGRVNAVMIGVGAAFDYHAGIIKRAPPWMQNAGLEWLHRLVSEPCRLWKRYLVTNTFFVLGAAWQLLHKKLF